MDCIDRMDGMTPVEAAARVYEQEPCARSFREDLEAHLLNGYVFSTPDLFMMGRAVIRDADPALIVNPWHVFPREACDCWLIYLVAGDMGRCFSFAPAELPWLCWERKNRLRFWRWDKTRHRVDRSAL